MTVAKSAGRPHCGAVLTFFLGKWEKGYHRQNRQQNSQGIAPDTEKARVTCTQNHHPAPHNHMSSALLTWTWRGEQCYRTRRHAPSQRPETLRKKEKKKKTIPAPC